jgi:hypothetical protein
MHELSSSSWTRRGSSIVFDRDALAPFIAGGSMVPLRDALAWMQKWPTDPPNNQRTVLVSGLETCIDVVTPEEAEQFLRSRIRPYIQEFQARWDQVGLLFGFTSSPHCFSETAAEEEVQWIRGDHQKIALSRWMWNGSSTLNMARIVRQDLQKSTFTVGYHVPRIS